MLTVKLSQDRGRGVFTTKNITNGELLAVDYSRSMTPEDIVFFDQTSMSGHWFDNPDLNGHGLLPLGISGLINHSYSPNVNLSWYKTELGYLGAIVALCDIDKDTEIFIDYGISVPENWC